METKRATVEDWCGAVKMDQVKEKITIVPILRSGLGIIEEVLEHL